MVGWESIYTGFFFLGKNLHVEFSDSVVNSFCKSCVQSTVFLTTREKKREGEKKKTGRNISGVLMVDPGSRHAKDFV